MKIVCRRATTDEKRKKMFIVGRRNAESLNFHSSSGDETKNTAKTARRRPTKARITHFLRFQPLGKSKIDGNCASNPLESQNHSFSAFPTPWKARITHFLRFQPLGKSELPKNCVSNPLESQNYSFFAFPTPWKVRITHFLPFQPLGKSKNGKKPPFIHG